MMSKTATASGGMILTEEQSSAQAPDVSGRPFRSSLRPHLEFIRAARRADKSWQEIADALRVQHSLEITGRGVGRFYAAATRRAERKAAWPLGMEPAPSTPDTTATTPTEQPGGRFRSTLFPHLAFIAAQRQDGQSWREIAEALREKGVEITHEGVRDFFGRTQARAARRARETSLPPAAGPEQAKPIPPTVTPTPQPSQGKPVSPFATKRGTGRTPRPLPGQTPPDDPLAGAGLD